MLQHRPSPYSHFNEQKASRVFFEESQKKLRWFGTTQGLVNTKPKLLGE